MISLLVTSSLVFWMFPNMSTCERLSLLAPCLLLLHLHFCHRLPGIPRGFAALSALTFSSLLPPPPPPPSPPVSSCVDDRVLFARVYVSVLQLTLFLSADRQPTVAAAKIAAPPPHSSN